MTRADAAEEKLRDEYDLLCRGVPSAREIAVARGEWPAVAVCPTCAPLRRLIARMVAAGIDVLDAVDDGIADREDDEREVVSEDDGVVDAMTLGRVIR